jgi:hypothetical protein
MSLQDGKVLKVFVEPVCLLELAFLGLLEVAPLSVRTDTDCEFYEVAPRAIERLFKQYDGEARTKAVEHFVARVKGNATEKFGAYADKLKSGGLDKFVADEETQKAMIMEATKTLTSSEFFKANPDLLPYIPCMHVLLPQLGGRVPSSSVTLRMSKPSLQLKAFEVLQKIIEFALQHERIVLTVENAQLLDAATLSVLASINPTMASHKCALVMTSRTLQPAVENKMNVQFPSLNKHVLRPLTRSETHQLVCSLLDVLSVDPHLIEHVQEKADGNPFYAGQIVAYLRQNDYIAVKNDHCLVKDLNKLNQMGAVSSMQGIMLARLEQITVQQQFVAKVASIAGLHFNRDLLQKLLIQVGAYHYCRTNIAASH